MDRAERDALRRECIHKITNCRTEDAGGNPTNIKVVLCSELLWFIEQANKVEALEAKLRGVCLEPGCEHTTKSRLPRYCFDHS